MDINTLRHSCSRAILIAILFCVNTAFAATVYLKNGQSVSGKIIEKTDKYIKIDFEGVELTYFNDEIANIEDNQATTDGLSTALTTHETQEGLYINDEYGFEVRGPKGWFMHKLPPQASLERGGVRFTKEPDENSLPSLVVIIDIIDSQRYESALDYARYIFQEFEKIAASKNNKMFTVEEPHEITVNNIKGSRFVFDREVSPSKTGGHSYGRMLDCKFKKDNTVVSVQGWAWVDTFQEHRKDFEETVNNFKFIKFTKKEITFTENKESKSYTNKDPYFSLHIPKNARRNWRFLLSNDSSIVIVTESFSNENKLPLIHCIVDPIPENELSKTKEELFKEIDAQHEQFEKEAAERSKNPFEIIKKGRLPDIAGFQTFERLLKLPRENKEGEGNYYHEVCIFLDKYLLQLALNTRYSDFAEDDQDFMSIINTLSIQQEE